ncbi:glycoside hydrolase family 79 protein [Mycena haematopus]|nr:glycoside hydrolase family 79 protein [Mycena haematopus]
MGSDSASGLLRSLCLVSLLLVGSSRANVTVYGQNNQAAFSTAPAGAAYTGVAAYNPGTLVPPPVPTPAVLTTIPINLQNSGTPNLSIKQKGSFFGFSIEMSVSNQILGKNSSLLQVPFLNLMANIAQRAGSVMVRVGGNSQESAQLAPDGSIPDGRVIIKNLTGVTGTTQTPPLEFSSDLLYMMRNISSLVNVHWFLGIPWFITQPFDTKIITAADEILGDYLLGLQAGNEPDMYNLHGHRNDTYGPYDYGGEISDLLSQVAASNADPSGRAMSLLVSPNIADYAWTPEQVWDTGLVTEFQNNIAYLAVEKYPRDNCAAMFGGPNATGILDPQATLPLYLTHDAHTQLLQPYLNSTMYAQTVNKPFLMFETNTASCGGFLGISDSFTAALWGLDFALQMAHSNFSGAMFHLGGQNVFYNAFTSPPTNESTFHQWSVGPLYYSALAMAEAMGPSNNTQVLNYGVADLSSFTPIYGIYENGTPVRVAIMNYLDDPTGASNVQAVISIAGTTIPSSVQVKRLSAASVVQKGNITWANQTYGDFFASDGRPMGQEVIETVNCDTTAQTCTVTVPAPGFALVFLASDASTQETAGAASMTFPTTAYTKTHNTATVDPSVLATSNGYRMSEHELAGTSKPPSAARHSAQTSLVVVGVVIGAVVAMLGRAL